MGYTENGWPGLPATDDMLNWVTVPGTNVKLQIQKGQPTTILSAFVADVNTYIEPVRNSDTACYTRENSVWNSNHRSGTAIDIDWDSHAFHVKGTFGDRLPKLRELLNWYEGTVFWGGDWTDPIDEMHFQMGYDTYQRQKTADFIAKKIRPDGLSTYKRDGVTATVAAVSEKVLPYNKSIVGQERPWDCCPASVQVALDSRGITRSEDQLIRDIGTNENGTNTVEQALPILNRLLPEAKYVAQWMPNDPPRPDQVEALWHNVKNSIDAGYPCVLNFEVPASNFPRGTRGSESPAYRGSKIWHYVCCPGYADDGPGGRHLWIADPGFRPFGYWMSLEQAATAIPPHAYAYSSAAVPGPKAQVPQKPVVVSAVEPARAGLASVSPYRSPGEPAVGGVERFVINDDGMLHLMLVEYSAMVLGDQESIARVVRAAAGHGAETSPEFRKRAHRVLQKVPREDLAAVLGRLQTVNPEWIDALRSDA